MWQEYTQQGLYRQLFHFRRQVDVQRALPKIPDQAQRDLAATRLAPVRYRSRLTQSHPTFLLCRNGQILRDLR